MTAPVPAADESPAEASAAPAPAPAPVLPDRADAPVSEVAERFLKAVLAEVSLDLIEELHLFSPLRQGTVETGIAVLAARTVDVVAEGEEPGLFDGAEDQPADTVPADTAAEGALRAEVVIADEGDDDEDVSYVGELSAVASADEEDEAVSLAVAPEIAAAPRPVRHTVYTARYRYVIKGPERGKWEASIKAEADAPLVTVETVVRGVQRRAGEESEIVRYSAAQIARALRLPLPG